MPQELERIILQALLLRLFLKTTQHTSAVGAVGEQVVDATMNKSPSLFFHAVVFLLEVGERAGDVLAVVEIDGCDISRRVAVVIADARDRRRISGHRRFGHDKYPSPAD